MSVNTTTTFDMTDGTTRPSVDNVVVTTSFYHSSGTLPETCLIYGRVIDSNNQPCVGASVVAAPLVTSEVTGTEYMVSKTKEISTTTASDGYWELVLVRSSAIGNTDYSFVITDSSSNVVESSNKTVPDLDQANYNDLS